MAGEARVASPAKPVTLLLDEAIGEYDVETKLGLIEMFAPETEAEGPRYPLTELPGHFDEVHRRLTARA